ncbi:MAG: hypothetical protein R2712_19690 [Vicinamibacterales bacterium]
MSLFQRAEPQHRALRSVGAKLASRGQFYNEDELVEHDVLDYTVDAAFSPDRGGLQGRVDLQLRVTRSRSPP